MKTMKTNKTIDEYVFVHELQGRMERLAREQQAQSEAEKIRLKNLHWMRCPKCGQELATELCDSVEIDVCPSCKGVWLDAGELGTIVESTSGFFQACVRVLRGARAGSVHLEAKGLGRRPG